MTRACRGETARLQMLFSEREQVAERGLGRDAALSCLIAAVTVELWNVDVDSRAQEVVAVQLQLWEWKAHCITLLNVLTTPGQADTWPHIDTVACWPCAATAHHPDHIKQIKVSRYQAETWQISACLSQRSCFSFEQASYMYSYKCQCFCFSPNM